MDSWFTALLSSASWSIGTKLGFIISFKLNFFLSGFFDLVDGVEVDGVFSSVVVFPNEGFWLSVGFSVVVGSLGDGVILVGDFWVLFPSEGLVLSPGKEVGFASVRPMGI